MRFRRVPALFACTLAASVALDLSAGQSATGRIEGRVTSDNGDGLGSVSVVLVETSATALTDRTGSFAFEELSPGSYTLSLALGVNADTFPDVIVESGATTTFLRSVDWQAGFADTMTVEGYSRRPERIVEAPGAVSTVDAAAIERQAAHGQIPKLIEFVPGAEITQSGVYDFNINTRGFNSSLNRRVAMLVDSRNIATPFLGSQDWAAVSFPLDDIERVEFLRGPSAALYGANASSGVLNITSKPPRFSQGGLVRFTVGELDTTNADLRWADGLGKGWYVKATGGMRLSGDFSVSRVGAAEYSEPCPVPQNGATDCLPQEALAIPRLSNDDIYYGAVRFDKYLSPSRVLTLEGGMADITGPVYQTAIGRVQTEAQRPWARVNLSSDRFSVWANYNARRSDNLSLSSGSNFVLDTYNLSAEGQANWSFASDRVRLVAGGSVTTEDIDSFDSAVGRQSLLFEPVDAQRGAVFGQVDWKPTEKLKLVLASRVDESTLHDPQFSPKGSIVWSFDPLRSLRFTYNEGFQVPNYAEFFLQGDVAPPADLSALNALCDPLGVDCGFGSTRVLALGNQNLQVEQIRSWEIGFRGVFLKRLLLTFEYYRSDADRFITDLLPQLGTPLGRVNPDFGAWQGPAGLPDEVAATIRTLAPPILSNNYDGSNILAALSYANFGRVDAQGADLGIRFDPDDHTTLRFSYSWFDFSVEDGLPGLNAGLSPNTPEHKLSTGLDYERGRWNGSFDVRWVDEFRWVAGLFQGNVESYTTADLDVVFSINEQWSLGTTIANLFDNSHFEAFGGDLLRRRALVNVLFKF